MKKCFIVILVILIFVTNFFVYSDERVYCEESFEIESELKENIDEQLSDLDFSNIENVYGKIDATQNFFNNNSFFENVKALISGDLSFKSNNFLHHLFSIFTADILEFLPSICLLVAIVILYSIVSGVQINSGSDIGKVMHFACYGSIVIILIAGITGVIGLTTSTLATIKDQMDAIFPVLLTLLTALGGNTSVAVYQPAMGALSGAVATIFTSILLPIFTFKVVFSILSNLSDGIKFNKFSEFMGTCFKWIMGLAITIFTAFISIQGIMAGSVDGISIRTAKYTIKGGVPIIGGFLSDGFGLIMASSSLIKNAVGVSGLLLLIITVLSPVIKIMVFSLLLKLVSAILEPVANTKITNVINEMGKSVSSLIALILGAGFMYFIITGLVMCGANVI